MEKHTGKVEILSPVSGSAAGDIINRGQALQQVRTPFTTAVTVQKPREIFDIKRRCEQEAALAGDSFYYAWTVKGEKGSSLIEGPSVDLAHAAVRNWGNCGVMVDVEERADNYIFTATFVDLETGFNLQRAFRQRKSQKMSKKMDDARQEDIVFQIGQSKAIRNVVVNALPSWLIDGMLEKSKENIVAKIEKKGIAQARQDTIAFFQKYGVGVERVEHKIQKKSTAWTVEDLALLYGAIKTLTEGVESPNELFPPIGGGAIDYGLPAELLEDINNLCDINKISDAEKAMKLGGLNGDVAKAEAWKKELEKELGV